MGIKNSILKSILMLNRFAIILFAIFGVDHISNQYNFPWQIIVFATVSLLCYDVNLNKRERKETLRDKIISFIEENEDLNLSVPQIMEIHSWYK